MNNSAKLFLSFWGSPIGRAVASFWVNDNSLSISWGSSSPPKIELKNPDIPPLSSSSDGFGVSNFLTSVVSVKARGASGSSSSPPNKDENVDLRPPKTFSIPNGDSTNSGWLNIPISSGKIWEIPLWTAFISPSSKLESDPKNSSGANAWVSDFSGIENIFS